jgi:hypothetical protein
VGAIVSVRMYLYTIVYFYIGTWKIWEMSAQADTNCHDIFNIVSVTRTHLAKIGVKCHVVPTCRDMLATFPAKVQNLQLLFNRVPTTPIHCYSLPKDWINKAFDEKYWTKLVQCLLHSDL